MNKLNEYKGLSKEEIEFLKEFDRGFHFGQFKRKKSIFPNKVRKEIQNSRGSQNGYTGSRNDVFSKLKRGSDT